MSNVIDFEKAQALMRVGAPLDTPVKEIFYSKKGSKLQLNVVKYMNQIYEYDNRQLNQKETDKLIVRVQKLDKAISALTAYAIQIRHSRDEVLAGEAQVHMAFLDQKALPFIQSVAQQLSDYLDAD